MSKILTSINIFVVVFMTAAYAYQMLYTLIGLIRRRAKPEAEPSQLHRFATLICARNESAVIGDLVKSLKQQDYPAQLLDIYVLADNCTDDTAEKARAAGAIVFERENHQLVGKGYAMDELLRNIHDRDASVHYDAYFVFDADNLVDSHFVTEMNKTFDRGYDAITCYRNSKNFGANWISAGYSIWFLREARFLNFPRMLLGTNCAVSGTGFLVSQKVIDENGGWPFHLLTEDIQFSVHCAVTGYKIGYCDRAVVYDEQPTSFVQSWKQRMRWAKGFYQVDRKYTVPLLRNVVRGGSGQRSSCYDMLMTVAPAMLLTLLSLVVNGLFLFVCLTKPYYVAHAVVRIALRYLSMAAVNFYLGLFLYGLLTVVMEWKKIHATALQKIAYLWLFPVFMVTYIPIALAALVKRVKWEPIQHFGMQQSA